MDGLKLFHVQGPSANDKNGDAFVVGVDPKGAIVKGVPLFQRAIVGQAPAEIARRAFDVLLAASFESPLDPTVDRRSSMYPEPEWALVKAPAVEQGVLTFWYIEGEMHPQVERCQIELATGAVTLRSAAFVLHPPEAAIPKIRERLQATDVATLKSALNEVSEWKELAPDVEVLLAHADKDVRYLALGTLGNLGQPRSIPAIAQLLATGREWGDRSLAGQTLVRRFGKQKDAIDAVRAYVQKGQGSHELQVLRDLLKDFDAGKVK